VLQVGTRARDLVQQILTFSRRAQAERTPLQLHTLVKEALLLLRTSLPSTIEIRPRLDPHSGAVLADATQLHQILVNLCANSEHAMRQRGGLLERTSRSHSYKPLNLLSISLLGHRGLKNN